MLLSVPSALCAGLRSEAAGFVLLGPLVGMLASCCLEQDHIGSFVKLLGMSGGVRRVGRRAGTGKEACSRGDAAGKTRLRLLPGPQESAFDYWIERNDNPKMEIPVWEKKAGLTGK